MHANGKIGVCGEWRVVVVVVVVVVVGIDGD